MSHPEAVFRVESVLRKADGFWTENEIRFFGRLSVGSLSIGDTVRVPVLGKGFVEVTIARFTEDFADQWLGLPFYETIQAGPDPLCVCVDGGLLDQKMIAVPALIEKYAFHQ